MQATVYVGRNAEHNRRAVSLRGVEQLPQGVV